MNWILFIETFCHLQVFVSLVCPIWNRFCFGHFEALNWHNRIQLSRLSSDAAMPDRVERLTLYFIQVLTNVRMWDGRCYWNEEKIEVIHNFAWTSKWYKHCSPVRCLKMSIILQWEMDKLIMQVVIALLPTFILLLLHNVVQGWICDLMYRFQPTQNKSFHWCMPWCTYVCFFVKHFRWAGHNNVHV